MNLCLRSEVSKMYLCTEPCVMNKSAMNDTMWEKIHLNYTACVDYIRHCLTSSSIDLPCFFLGDSFLWC